MAQFYKIRHQLQMPNCFKITKQPIRQNLSVVPILSLELSHRFFKSLKIYNYENYLFKIKKKFKFMKFY